MILTGRAAGVQSHSISLHLEVNVRDGTVINSPSTNVICGGSNPNGTVKINCGFEPDDGIHGNRFAFQGFTFDGENLDAHWYYVNGTSADVTITIQGGNQLEGIIPSVDQFSYAFHRWLQCNLGYSFLGVDYTSARIEMYIDGHLLSSGTISGSGLAGFKLENTMIWGQGDAFHTTGTHHFVTLTSKSLHIGGTYNYTSHVTDYGHNYYCYITGSGNTIDCWSVGDCNIYLGTPAFDVLVYQAGCTLEYTLDIPNCPEGVTPEWSAACLDDPVTGFSATRDYQGEWMFGHVTGGYGSGTVTMSPVGNSGSEGWEMVDVPPTSCGDMTLLNPEDFNDVELMQLVGTDNNDNPLYEPVRNNRIMFVPDGLPNVNLTMSAVSKTIDGTAEGIEHDELWVGTNCTVTSLGNNRFSITDVEADASIRRGGFAHEPYGDEGTVPANLREAHFPCSRFVWIDGECTTDDANFTIFKKLQLKICSSQGDKEFKIKKISSDPDNYKYDTLQPIGQKTGDMSTYDDYYHNLTAESHALYGSHPDEQMYRLEEGFVPWDWGIGTFNAIEISGFEVDKEYTIEGVKTYVSNLKVLCYDEWKPPSYCGYNLNYDEGEYTNSVTLFANRRILCLVDGKPGCEMLVNMKSEVAGHEVNYWTYFTIDSMELGDTFPRDDYNSIVMGLPSYVTEADGDGNYPIGRLYSPDFCLVGWVQPGCHEDESHGASVTIPITPRFDSMTLDWRWNDNETVCNGRIDIGGVAHGVTPIKPSHIDVTTTEPYDNYYYTTSPKFHPFYNDDRRFVNPAKLECRENKTKYREFLTGEHDEHVLDGFIYDFSVAVIPPLTVDMDNTPDGIIHRVIVGDDGNVFYDNSVNGKDWSDSVQVTTTGDTSSPNIVLSHNVQDSSGLHNMMKVYYERDGSIHFQRTKDGGDTWDGEDN
jgi:hypothetical protein